MGLQWAVRSGTVGIVVSLPWLNAFFFSYGNTGTHVGVSMSTFKFSDLPIIVIS